jgi:hypothetical protein
LEEEWILKGGDKCNFWGNKTTSAQALKFIVDNQSNGTLQGRHMLINMELLSGSLLGDACVKEGSIIAQGKEPSNFGIIWPLLTQHKVQRVLDGPLVPPRDHVLHANQRQSARTPD